MFIKVWNGRSSVMSLRHETMYQDPFLRVLIPKASGLVSVSKATGPGHKPIVLRLGILQAYGLVKLLNFNEFFLKRRGLQHGARWHQVARTDHLGRSRACSDNMVYSGTFFLVKSRNSTNAAWGKTMTSKITNWFHVDENINNISRFNFRFI